MPTTVSARAPVAKRPEGTDGENSLIVASMLGKDQVSLTHGHKIWKAPNELARGGKYGKHQPGHLIMNKESAFGIGWAVSKNLGEKSRKCCFYQAPKSFAITDLTSGPSCKGRGEFL